MASVLDLDELFTRIAQLTKRVIEYRTFGILLVNDTAELDSVGCHDPNRTLSVRHIH